MFNRFFSRQNTVEVRETSITELPPVAMPSPIPLNEDQAPRNKQKNIKATEACLKAFDRIAVTLELTAAELFEDLVAERYERLKEQKIIDG
jgi:hypothetical protein